jgi:hypothetical protein
MPTAARDARACGAAGAQWIHTSEDRREYEVPVHAKGDIRGAHSDDPIGHARDGVRGVRRGLSEKNYL